jgi:hypothetical protein
MKQLKSIPQPGKREALQALKIAIVEGATWRYEHLVAMALKAGVTDDEIDTVAHEALRALLAEAEQPLTARELAHCWQGGHFRS